MEPAAPDDSPRETAQRDADLEMICKQFRRGIISANEACVKILCCRIIEPSRVAEFVGMLPGNIRAVLPAVLARMPTSDEEWVNFNLYAQFDGNEWTWVQHILHCRADTEVVRSCLLGEISPPAAPDFVDRIRAEYHDRLNEVRHLPRELAG